MAKLDRLGWTAGFAFTSFGVPIGVRVNDAGVLERIFSILPPDWKPLRSRKVELLYSLMVGGVGARPNIKRFNLLYANAARAARSMDMDEVLQTLESDLQQYVAERSPGKVFVHAGVVGWKGKAILVPGRSYTGKTTLVAELVRAGAIYYSDEYAVLDSQGRVHPYSRPLAIRPAEGGRAQKHSVEELGGRSGVRPLPVALVLVGKYKAGARWRPRPISAGQGALALLDNTVSIRRQPEMAFNMLEKVVSKARVLKGVRGEAKDIVESILDGIND